MYAFWRKVVPVVCPRLRPEEEVAVPRLGSWARTSWPAENFDLVGGLTLAIQEITLQYRIVKCFFAASISKSSVSSSSSRWLVIFAFGVRFVGIRLGGGFVVVRLGRGFVGSGRGGDKVSVETGFREGTVGFSLAACNDNVGSDHVKMSAAKPSFRGFSADDNH